MFWKFLIMNIRTFFNLSLFSIILIFTDKVIASAHDHGSSTNINWWKIGSEYKDVPALGWYSITFLILIILFGYIVKKYLVDFYKNRSLEIKKQIEDANEMKLLAESNLNSHLLRIKNFTQEIETIKKDFIARGEKEKINAEELGKILSNQIQENTENLISAQVKQVKMNLKNEVVKIIINESIKELESNTDCHFSKQYERQVINDLLDIKINT